MKATATRKRPHREAADATARTSRRVARKREARQVQVARSAEVAGLVAEGRFAEARAVFDSYILGEAGDPRVRLSPDPEAPPLQRPVFVCGLHRSGTTLLVDRLKARFDLAWLQNIRVPEAEGQFVQDVYPQEMPFGGPGSFAFAPQMRLRPVTDPTVARDKAARLAACWGGFARGGARLLEKSPSNIVRIGYLRSLFPDARFIVWTRDPRAVSLATQKWRRRADLGTLMLHWSTAYYAALDDLQDDCVIASYEAFCEDPDGELDRIGRFCELEERATPVPSQERFEEIRNSNDKYVAEFAPEALRIPGLPSWELFGYHLSGERRRQAEPAEGEPISAATTAEAPAPARKRQRKAAAATGKPASSAPARKAAATKEGAAQEASPRRARRRTTAAGEETEAVPGEV